jgi:hypothetical protein
MAIPQFQGLEFVVLTWMVTESTSAALESFRSWLVAKFREFAAVLLALVPPVERAEARALEWQSRIVVKAEERNATSD